MSLFPQMRDLRYKLLQNRLVFWGELNQNSVVGALPAGVVVKVLVDAVPQQLLDDGLVDAGAPS